MDKFSSVSENKESHMKNSLLIALLLVSGITFADSARVSFHQGWIKNLPPVVPVRAGYIQIKNPGDVPVEIISLESDLFESVEIHETVMENGMMKMDALDKIVLPPKTTVVLKPGEKHIMLITQKFPLAIGDTVNVTVTFNDQKTQIIQLEVKQ